MHHSTVLLCDGSLLLCGGRASPVKPSSSFFQLRLEGAMAVWSCINLDPTSDFPEPRWRHTATSIIWSNGRLAVLLQLELCIMFFWFFIRNWRCCYHWRVHNKCVSMQGLLHVEYQWMENKEGRQCSFLLFVSCVCVFLTYCYYCFLQLPVTLPEGRHSHCTLQYGKGVIIAGGLNSAMVPIGSCLHLSWSADGWCLDEIAFNPPLPPRYLHILPVRILPISCMFPTTGYWPRPSDF